MSKTYKCKVIKDIVERHFASDEIEYSLGLLDILPPDEMQDLYKEAIKSLGGEEKKDESFEFIIDGIRITISPSDRTAKVRLSEEKDLHIHFDRNYEINASTFDGQERAQEKAEEKAEPEIIEELNKHKKDHFHEVKKKLEDSEEKVKEKLRELSNEAHKNALRKKARALGRINVDKEESLTEGEKRLTIEIEI